MNLRPELTQRLRQRLQDFGEGFRHNLAILGPQGSGKTYQLQQLLVVHPQPLLAIYCPLYRESCRSFLQRFLGAMLQAALHKIPSTPLERTGDAAAPSLDALVQQAELQLPRTAAAIHAIEGLLMRRQYGEAFTRTLDVIPLISQERGIASVLILDEFLFLEDLGLSHAFHELGKRVMTWPSTLFILSSSSLHRARTILRERLQLLFGQFELLTLDALDSQMVATWAQHELKGLRRPKTLTGFLLGWLGAYPWYLTVFVHRLRERAALSKSTELTEPLFLQTAWDVLGSAEGTLHQWCLSRTSHLARGRVGSRALEALIHIAKGVRTTTEIGKRTGRGGITEVLQVLVEQDLAQRNGMCWIVTDPLLRCWLSTVLDAQWSDAHTEGSELRQRFDQYLRALWHEWIYAQQRSFSEQIAGLFAKFADDTVSLDLKTGRLPRFHTIQRTDGAEGAVSAEPYLIAEANGKRWCVTVREAGVDEYAIARFDAFCKAQTPRPSRKVVITKVVMDPHARLLAKAANMWVWGPDDLNVLLELYGRA